jgi:CO/xanthine dehydrogenase Mo-binding subunit
MIEFTLNGEAVHSDKAPDTPLLWVLCMPEMPDIEVHIVASALAPSGVGEPGVPPLAPALANALYRAAGKRLRGLPLGRKIAV